MTPGTEGSTASPLIRPDVILPPAGARPASGSSVNSPNLISSETVINTTGPRPVLMTPAGDSPSAIVLQRLFPPVHEVGSSLGSFNPAGIELGHFRIEERIGMGGMGAVFRAVDTRLQRHVALKLLAPSQSHDGGSVKRFQNEARAAARLDHDNVARVYFIGEDKGLHYIAFEFITGSTIRELIRRKGRLSPVDTVNYALQIAFALKHTSAMGVVHRDIKPSNIIITPNGRAKLVDLGLARNDSTESVGELTLPGTTLGTFDYISPEQAKDPRSVDVRSDIYSLGCTMYHMLTGQPPYPEGTVLQKLLDHQASESPDPAEFNPQVPEALSGIVRRMMNSDRNKRYQTADQLIRDLSQVAASQGLRGVNPEGLVWVASRSLQPRLWTSHMGWVVTVGLLLLVAGALQQFPDLSRRITGGTGINEPIRSPDSVAPETVPSSGSGNVSSAEAVITPSEITAAKTNSGTSEDSSRPSASPSEPGGKKPGAVAPGNSLAASSPSAATTEKPSESGVSSPARSDDRPGTQVASAASAGTAERPARNADSTVPEQFDERQFPIVIHAENGTSDRRYRTLEAACSDAADGSVIELAFTGTRTEKSFRLARKNITIRAATGHTPVIELVPSDLDAASSSARMVSIQAGPVRLVNVHFVMRIPERASSERYSLFAMSRPGQLRMDGVAVTVINPRRVAAAILEVNADAVRMPADMPTMPSALQKEELELQLVDCLFRGEASLASLAWKGQFQLQMQNCAAGLAGDLVLVRSAMSPVAGERNQNSVKLEHVTAYLEGSLLRFEGPLSIDDPLTRCEVRNCLLTGNGEPPLILSDAAISAEDARRLLLWSGERNFYCQTKTFWATGSGTGYDFEAWRNHWGPAAEVSPVSTPVNWTSIDPTDQSWEYQDLSPSNFALKSPRDTINPAIRGATDGRDAGCDITRLPRQNSAPTADDETAVQLPL